MIRLAGLGQALISTMMICRFKQQGGSECMYKAVGAKTSIVFAYASSKRELMRNLNKCYPWVSSKVGTYPEPLRIEEEEKK